MKIKFACRNDYQNDIFSIVFHFFPVTLYHALNISQTFYK